MRWIPLLLLFAVAVSGCASVDVPGAVDDTVEEAVAPPFVEVRSLIAAGDGGAEPSLGVTPDGVLFTDLYTNVYRSTDNGTTWELVAAPLDQILNADPDLAVSIDGTVWESHLYVACVAVSSSQDQGETWTSQPAACSSGGGDRQYVVPTEGCEAFLYLHQLPSFQQTVSKTTDCGLTWVPLGSSESPGSVIFATGGSGWGGGGFYNPVTGSVYFTYSNSGAVLGSPLATAAGPGFSVTYDGLLFSSDTAATYDGQTLGLGLVTGAADQAGNVYLTWGESYDGDVAIYVAGSQDDGETWTDKVRIDNDTTSKVFPVVTAGADGHIAVAYYEAGEQAHPDDVQGDWNVTLAWTDDFFGNGTWQEGQLNAEPVKTGPICISGTTCTGDREFADYFDAVTMPDGKVGVTYNRLIDGALRNEFALTGAPLLAA